MLRDAQHRGTDPARTVEHWHYVRRGELKHIIPHLGRADAIINGALPYELPIFKSHLEPLFPSFLDQWRDDPRRSDAFTRAQRITALLAELQPAGDACVPANSALREFIGGSAYGAH
jgi:uridine kinase